MNNLKELRLKKGMNQADLAKHLNCTAMTVSRYESGSSDIDSATIVRLCSVLGCTADYLLGLSDLQTPEISDDEARLLLAYRRADDRAHDMVKLALAPFAQEDGSSETA